MTRLNLESLERRAGEIPSELYAQADEYRYGNKGLDRSWVLLGMASGHLTLGVYELLVRNDVPRFKQEFYVASALLLARYLRHNAQDMDTGTIVSYSILSDCCELIQQVAQLAPRRHVELREKPREINFLIYMDQLCLLGDDKKLRELIEIGAKHSGKKYREDFLAHQDLFSLVLARDQIGLERRIAKLALIKTAIPPFEGRIALGALKEAKLCWMNGIEVQIAAPTVPNAVLPVAPLSYYDPTYDFLTPDWKPAPRGRIGTLFSSLKGRLGSN
jgi:hypothetical protein